MGCLGFALTAILSFYTAVSLIMFIHGFLRPGFCLRVSLKICTIVGAIGIVLTGCFPLNGVSYVHFFWAIVGLGGFNVVEFLVWIGCWWETGWKMNLYQAVVLVMQLSGLVACALSDKYGAVRHVESFSAVGEWTFVLGLPFFLVPYARKLRNVSPRLVITYEKNG
jgi:hypothetical protein